MLNEKRSKGVGPAKTKKSSQRHIHGESPAQFHREELKNIADKSGTKSMTAAQRKAAMKDLMSGKNLERSAKPGVSVKAKRPSFKAWSKSVKSIPESFVYAFNMWSFMLAEAGRKLGPIAQRYEGQKTTDITDRRLRAAAKREKARVEKKLGIKTNPDAGQLVQQHQERRRKKKRKVLGLPPETPDIARADRAEDKRKMRGDR